MPSAAPVDDLLAGEVGDALGRVLRHPGADQ
jgi:hypothetical protein